MRQRRGERWELAEGMTFASPIGQISHANLSSFMSLQVLNHGISTEDCTCLVAFQDRWRIAIAP